MSLENETEVDRNADQPVPIVVVDSEHRFCLDEKAISSILLQNDIMNLPVAVISVAGAFRKGKSFLLNFFLRYLTNYGTDNWLGGSDELLSGFSWRGGSDRDTTGILMWSKVFKISLKCYHLVPILELSLSGFIMSIREICCVNRLHGKLVNKTLLNIAQNILKTVLNVILLLFTEYGRLAMEESSEKPFQSLQFLVRDWSYPYEYEFGYEGGRKLLDKRLELTEQQHEELQRVRTHIRSCFSGQWNFFSNFSNFFGSSHLINIDKLKNYHTYAHLYIYYNLVVKTIFVYIHSCPKSCHFFAVGDLFYCKQQFKATAEANNLSAVSKAKDVYVNLMEEVCGGDKPFLNPARLEDKHQEHRQTSLDGFDGSRKMGGVEFSMSYRDQLEVDINESYENFCKNNDAKNVFRYARTPAVFFAFGAVSYILSGLFGFLYLTSFSTIFSLLCMATLVALVMWAYVRYTGEHQAIGQALEVTADFIWDTFMEKMYESIIKPGTNQLRDEAFKQVTQKIKSN
uniref:GB1/RHD3-type G domain-containing protein n=1 Tax=Ciona savignyi TaxID=51511 RepID=H2Y8W1_CIOSA